MVNMPHTPALLHVDSLYGKYACSLHVSKVVGKFRSPVSAVYSDVYVGEARNSYYIICSSC